MNIPVCVGYTLYAKMCSIFRVVTDNPHLHKVLQTYETSDTRFTQIMHTVELSINCFPQL